MPGLKIFILMKKIDMMGILIEVKREISLRLKRLSCRPPSKHSNLRTVFQQKNLKKINLMSL